MSLAIERLAVNLGKEIVSLMPGYVSTEVSVVLPHISFLLSGARGLILRKQFNSIAEWDHCVVVGINT